MSDKMQELVSKLTSEVKTSVDTLKKIAPQKWTFKSFLGVLPEVTSLIKNLIISVEALSTEVKEVSGGDKKAAVMEILNALVDSGTIKIPWVPDWVAKAILSMMVDKIVDLYNEKFGKLVGEKPTENWIREPSFSVISVR